MFSTEQQSSFSDNETEMFLTHDILNIFRTENGFFGYCYFAPSPDDIFVVIPGCSRPLIMQRVDSHYILRGACFILGYELSRVLEEVKQGLLKQERIEIR